MKISPETQEIIAMVKQDAYDIEKQVKAMLAKLGRYPGTIKNAKQLERVIPVLEKFIHS